MPLAEWSRAQKRLGRKFFFVFEEESMQELVFIGKKELHGTFSELMKGFSRPTGRHQLVVPYLGHL